MHFLRKQYYTKMSLALSSHLKIKADNLIFIIVTSCLVLWLFVHFSVCLCFPSQRLDILTAVDKSRFKDVYGVYGDLSSGDEDSDTPKSSWDIGK